MFIKGSEEMKQRREMSDLPIIRIHCSAYRERFSDLFSEEEGLARVDCLRLEKKPPEHSLSSQEARAGSVAGTI